MFNLVFIFVFGQEFYIQIQKKLSEHSPPLKLLKRQLFVHKTFPPNRQLERFARNKSIPKGCVRSGIISFITLAKSCPLFTIIS